MLARGQREERIVGPRHPGGSAAVVARARLRCGRSGGQDGGQDGGEDRGDRKIPEDHNHTPQTVTMKMIAQMRMVAFRFTRFAAWTSSAVTLPPSLSRP